PVSKTRLWVFRLLAMTLVPALCLLLLEGGLRLTGYGVPTGFFVSSESRDVLVTNEKFGWRFFPKAIARGPVQRALPPTKPENAVRVIVLGASAAQGYPDHTFGLTRQIDAMLRARFPDARFEVINTGVAAINSHAVRLIAQDAAQLKPDVFVIYLGNNEVVGPYGPGTVFADFTQNLSMIRASLWAKSTRIGQLIESMSSNSGERDALPDEWEGMQMFAPNRVAASDPRLDAVYAHFRSNLSDICRIGRDAGAEVVISTVAVNLRDHSPFASAHRPGLTPTEQTQWDEHLAQGDLAAAEGDHIKAVGRFNEAMAIDDQHAALRFRLAQSLEQSDRVGEARLQYRAARDLDTLRFRADSRINSVIREVAENEPGVRLVDAERAFDEAPGTVNGLSGDESFSEHVHMNFAGNHLLAATLLPAVVDALPQTVRGQATGPGEPLSLQEATAAMAYTPWDRRRIALEFLNMTGEPPFTMRHDHARRHNARREATDALLVTYDTTKTSAEAYRRAIEANPDDLVLPLQLAFILLELGQYDQAVTLMGNTLDAFPEHTPLREHLQRVKSTQLEFNKARDQRRIAAQRDPGNPDHPNNLGILYHRHRRYDEAIQAYQDALKIKPDYAAVYYNLGITYMAANRPIESLGAYRFALELSPDLYQVHHNLANALQDLDRVDESLHHYRETIRIRPDHHFAHRNYALALRKLKRFDEAIEHLETAQGLKPDYHQATHDLDETIRMKLAATR
ncbi:MAG: tetratricopeptide repeat protein, partial [Planctomycetota bacterium]